MTARLAEIIKNLDAGGLLRVKILDIFGQESSHTSSLLSPMHQDFWLTVSFSGTPVNAWISHCGASTLARPG